MHYQVKVQWRRCKILCESTGELLNVLIEGPKHRFISTHNQSSKHSKFSIDSVANMMNCNSSVNNMTGNRMDKPHFIPTKTGTILFTVKQGLWHPAYCQVDTESFSHSLKQLEHEVNTHCSLVSGCKHVWSFTFLTSLHLHGMVHGHRNNFSFLFYLHQILCFSCSVSKHLSKVQKYKHSSILRVLSNYCTI
jgi:hypothetical protein